MTDEASKPIMPPEELRPRKREKTKEDKLRDYRDQRANGETHGSYEPEYT